jgi:hypothetical protein
MNEIFVFGSNLHGIHKRGAALCALREHGAKLGQGIGLQGQSYAVPTKSTPYESLELVSINKFVADFLNYAHWTPDLIYNVTPIGCGLAGYKPFQIAPMFQYAKFLKNVNLPPEFLPFLCC